MLFALPITVSRTNRKKEDLYQPDEDLQYRDNKGELKPELFTFRTGLKYTFVSSQNDKNTREP